MNTKSRPRKDHHGNDAGNVIETHEHAGDFKERSALVTLPKRFRFLNAELFGTILAIPR